MDSKPRSGGLSGEEKRIFMDMVTTLAPALIFPVASAVPSEMTSFPLTKSNRALETQFRTQPVVAIISAHLTVSGRRLYVFRPAHAKHFFPAPGKSGCRSGFCDANIGFQCLPGFAQVILSHKVRRTAGKGLSRSRLSALYIGLARICPFYTRHRIMSSNADTQAMMHRCG